MILLALLVQAVIFGVYYYLDAKAMLAKSWSEVVSLGLHPLTTLFYALTVVPMWWSFRVFYHTVGERFWLAIMANSVFLQAVYIIVSWAASKETPTKYEWVGIVICLIGTIVAGIKE